MEGGGLKDFPCRFWSNKPNMEEEEATGSKEEQKSRLGNGVESSPGEPAMDGYLRSQGLYRKRVAKDGSCLFRAVAEQVKKCGFP